MQAYATVYRKVYALELPDDGGFAINDKILVKTEEGVDVGEIRLTNLPNDKLKAPSAHFVGPFDAEAGEKLAANIDLESEVRDFATRRIQEERLNMKVIAVHYLYDRTKATFFFIAEGRRDFRVLVRDLAKKYQIRVEMRQTGVREEGKIVGGIGPCGQMLCCFKGVSPNPQISINMAKNQGLSLNPAKISGVCGRLMCCLNYEDAVYKQLKSELPSLGEMVTFRTDATELKGEPAFHTCKVHKLNPLKGTFSVWVEPTGERELRKDDIIKG